MMEATIPIDDEMFSPSSPIKQQKPSKFDQS